MKTRRLHRRYRRSYHPGWHGYWSWRTVCHLSLAMTGAFESDTRQMQRYVVAFPSTSLVEGEIVQLLVIPQVDIHPQRLMGSIGRSPGEFWEALVVESLRIANTECLVDSVPLTALMTVGGGFGVLCRAGETLSLTVRLEKSR